MRRTALRIAAGLVAVTAFGIGSGGVPANAGGGCHRPVTDETGTAVAMREMCFAPTLLYTRPGQSITWVNGDPFDHVLVGAQGSWGSFEEVGPGEKLSFRFSHPGVYPYACYLHPGMTGAVVVGNPKATAGDSSTIAQQIASSNPTPDASERTAPRTVIVRSDGVSSAWQVAALTAAGLLLLTCAALILRRRSLRRPVAS